MKGKQAEKIIYFLFPIFVIASIIELVLLIKSNSNVLQGNNKEINRINIINYNDEMKLGDILFDSANVNYDNTTSGLSSTNVKAAIDELYNASNTCVTNLGTCNSNYSSCSSSLSTCNTDKTTAQNNYSTCSSNLSTCNSQKSTCQSNYSTCQSSLSTAQSNYSTCSSSLSTCNSQKSTCQSNLSTCQTQLANIPKTYYAFGTPTTSSTTDYTTLNKKVFVALNGTKKSVCIIRNSKLHCFDINNFNYEQWHVQGVFNDISCDVDPAIVSCYASDFTCWVSSAGYLHFFDESAREYCDGNSNGSVQCVKW